MVGGWVFKCVKGGWEARNNNAWAVPMANQNCAKKGSMMKNWLAPQFERTVRPPRLCQKIIHFDIA